MPPETLFTVLRYYERPRPCVWCALARQRQLLAPPEPSIPLSETASRLPLELKSKILIHYTTDYISALIHNTTYLPHSVPTPCAGNFPGPQMIDAMEPAAKAAFVKLIDALQEEWRYEVLKGFVTVCQKAKSERDELYVFLESEEGARWRLSEEERRRGGHVVRMAKMAEFLCEVVVERVKFK